MTDLDQNDGNWSEQARGHVKNALEALRAAPEKPEQLFQPAARRFCEKTLAALDLHFAERQKQQPDWQRTLAKAAQKKAEQGRKRDDPGRELEKDRGR